MVRFNRLSSFTVIGIILLAIGLYGLWRGPRFAFDPGTPAEPGEALYYIFVGALMIVNGFFWMKPAPQETPPGDKDNPGPAQKADKP